FTFRALDREELRPLCEFVGGGEVVFLPRVLDRVDLFPLIGDDDGRRFGAGGGGEAMIRIDEGGEGERRPRRRVRRCLGEDEADRAIPFFDVLAVGGEFAGVGEARFAAGGVEEDEEWRPAAAGAKRDRI